jgi:hypothetical protein
MIQEKLLYHSTMKKTNDSHGLYPVDLLLR